MRLLDLANNDLDMSLYDLYNKLIIHLKSIPKLQFLNFKENLVETKISNFKYFIIHELPKLEYYNYSKVTREVCPLSLIRYPHFYHCSFRLPSFFFSSILFFTTGFTN